MLKRERSPTRDSLDGPVPLKKTKMTPEEMVVERIRKEKAEKQRLSEEENRFDKMSWNCEFANVLIH